MAYVFVTHMLQHTDLTEGSFGMHRRLKRFRKLLDGYFHLSFCIIR